MEFDNFISLVYNLISVVELKTKINNLKQQTFMLDCKDVVQGLNQQLKDLDKKFEDIYSKLIKIGRKYIVD